MPALVPLPLVPFLVQLRYHGRCLSAAATSEGPTQQPANCNCPRKAACGALKYGSPTSTRSGGGTFVAAASALISVLTQARRSTPLPGAV